MLLALLIACGSADGQAPPTVALGEPWSAWSLPLEGAEVISSRPDTLHLRVEGAELAVVRERWHVALEQAGFEPEVALELTAADRTAGSRWSTEEHLVSLGLVTHADHTAVTLALVPR
jgi:hypothetical protein